MSKSVSYYEKMAFSFSTLLSLRSRVDPNRELFSCLNLALKQLSLEPPCIRNNARLTIDADHKLLEWVFGKGDCEIIICIQGKAQYHVSVTTWAQYLACLCSQPQPLSLGSLLTTRSKLRCWSPSQKALACFDKAVECFAMEPSSVKEDAQMLVECDGRAVQFISGQGLCEISVFFSKDGGPEYNVLVKSETLFLERLQAGAVQLNVENLRKARDGIELPGVKKCLKVALSKFQQEPWCIQNNAKMVVIMGGKERIMLSSGKGENQIAVTVSENGIRYQVSTWGWWDLVARMLSKIQ